MPRTKQPAAVAATPLTTAPSAAFSARFSELLEEGAELLGRQRIKLNSRVIKDTATLKETENWLRSLSLLGKTCQEFHSWQPPTAVEPELSGPTIELSDAEQLALEKKLVTFVRAWEESLLQEHDPAKS